MEPRHRNYSWTLALIIAGLSSLVHSDSLANVPVREIAAKVGSPANFTCGSNGVPIFICLWDRQADNKNKKFSVSISAEAASKGQTADPGYGFFGPGFDSGSCGLQIRNVRDEDNAVWSCRLITSAGQVFEGEVRVGILKKPSPPVFSKNVEQIKNLRDPEEQKVDVSVTCGSYGGQPEPKYRWFIGSDEVTEGLGPYENTTYSNEFWIHQTLTGHKFTATDNGKFLRCVVVHDALTESDKKETAEKIVVYYAPKADSEIKPGFVPGMGKDVTLSVNISANPKPTVLWRVGDMTIDPSKNRGDKYVAYNLVEVSNGVWAAGLQIKNIEEEDLPKVYQLEAQNLYGPAVFDLRLSSNDPALASSGLSAGGIVGLILGIAALLILIAVIVVYTRARGLLCFKGDDGTASEKERMDGESGGPGVGAEEKPVTVTQSLSSRLSAIYENLVAKKKDKTAAAPVDDESNKPEKEGIPAEHPVTEKKEEDIVYAQLDLVNETGGKQVVHCADDKTEYAEIVGVVPIGTNLEEPTREKSPSGSLKSSPKK